MIYLLIVCLLDYKLILGQFYKQLYLQCLGKYPGTISRCVAGTKKVLGKYTNILQPRSCLFDTQKKKKKVFLQTMGCGGPLLDFVQEPKTNLSHYLKQPYGSDLQKPVRLRLSQGSDLTRNQVRLRLSQKNQKPSQAQIKSRQ